MKNEISAKRKYALYILILLVFAAAVVAMLNYYPVRHNTVDVKVVIDSNSTAVPQLYYTFDSQANENNFSANHQAEYTGVADGVYTFKIPSNATFIRYHFNDTNAFVIRKVSLAYKDKNVTVAPDKLTVVPSFQGIDACYLDEAQQAQIVTSGNDPYLSWDIREYDIDTMAQDHSRDVYKQIHMVGLAVIVVSFLVVIACRKKIIFLLNELYNDKKLIYNLSKTDFKSKYSGSYFGIFWAFVQPVVTVAIYTFVFQVGFKAGNTVGGYPFLLYLVAGIIPWFFFAESWMCATGCLVEYNFLVKKVVFKIDVLPIVKIISSMFVHMFFIGLSLVIYVINGRLPGVEFIQILYYILCTFAFTMALSYLSAAVTPFFKDITQIINILTQLGMWTIPIMYDEAIIGERIMRFLRFNPMYYVVRGYRDCFMHGQWFWNDMKMTLYFWIVVAGLFAIGYRSFQKLKVHFADVL